MILEYLIAKYYFQQLNMVTKQNKKDDFVSYIDFMFEVDKELRMKLGYVFDPEFQKQFN